MMERVCKRCGQVYRGLVCQQCHPRRDKRVSASGDKAAYLLNIGCVYGPHVINGAGPHLAELRRLQPRLALVLDPSADDVRALRAACPGTVIIGRIYVPDSEVETRIRANPEGAAAWAHELTLAQPAYVTGAVNYWQIANEVLQFWDGLPLLSRFEVARMRLAQGRYGCGILAFSVGQPDLPAADRLALWRQVYPALAAAEAGSHVVVVHQYGAPDLWGPAEQGGAAWLCNRLEQQVLPILPYKKVKFAVCEYGIDGLLLGEAVRSGEDTPAEPVFGVGVCVPSKDLKPVSGLDATAAFSGPAGWQRYTDAAGYVKQLVDMGSYLEPFSSQIIGYAIFTLGHNAPWGSYDIAGEVLRRLANHYASTTVTPVTLAQRLQVAFGAQFTDLRTSLPHHATLKYETRPLSAIQQVILHHTATAQSTTWQTVATYHVNSRGWPGIAYHLGVHADGRVALLNDPETISYHAGNANGSSVAISVMGNYETDAVNAMLWQRILDVKTVLAAYLGRPLPMSGHRDTTSATVCPGKNLYAKLTNPNPEAPPMANDPRAANCKAFHMDASGRVDGIELVYQPVPSARYACIKAELIDEATAQGNTVVTVNVLDADGVLTAERAMMVWPYGGPPAADSPTGPGNTDNRFTTTSKYAPPAIGPLGFIVADANKQPISDYIWGYGLPGGRHISGRVTFKERSGAVVPPVEPGGALPESEPILPVGQLADKCRWWLEESVRQDEAGNTVRAKAIRYSLIKRDNGLFYRLENALKAGQPTG
jgi:hypothetical protein